MPNHYTTLMICSPGYDFNVADFNERHKESCLCSIVAPMPESVEQVRSVHYPDGTTEKERLGVDQDWYDWAKENWGTKWGTYDAKAFELGGDGSPVLIKFQSAWGPPKVLDKTCRQGEAMYRRWVIGSVPSARRRPTSIRNRRRGQSQRTPPSRIPTNARGTFCSYTYDGRLARVRMPNGTVRMFKRENVKRIYRMTPA
jgi:hypothetical protein